MSLPGQILANGTDRGGGEGVSTEKRKVLFFDLSQDPACSWKKGDDLLSEFREWPAIWDRLHGANAGFGYRLTQELERTRFCFTPRSLRPLPSDEQKGISVYTVNTRQLAIRIENEVFIDTKLFDELAGDQRPYFLLHELLHGLIPWKTTARIDKIRDFVKQVHDAGDSLTPKTFARLLSEAQITVPDLTELLKTSVKAHMGARLDPSRENAAARYLEEARLLISQGANPDFYIYTPPTLITDYAMQACDPELLEFLLNQGANPNKLNQNSRPLLQSAAEVEKRFEQDLYLRKHYGGEAPKSCPHGASFLKLLLEHGADPKAPQNKDLLHFAIQGGLSAQSFLLLVEYGADITRKTEKGTTLLQAVFDDGLASGNIAEVLQAILETLKKKGIDPRHQGLNDPMGFHQTTPLHQAAYLDDPRVLAILLANGADQSATNRDGDTPLVAAIMSYGKDRTNQGRSDRAVSDKVALLLRSGSGAKEILNHENAFCHRALHYAESHIGYFDGAMSKKIISWLKYYGAKGDSWHPFASCTLK